MITFDAAMEDAEQLIIAQGCKTEVRGYFTNGRVDRKTLPDGWNAYDIRHGDNGSFCILEPRVIANHAGTFLTEGTVRMNKDGYYSLRGRGGYTF